jgi:hypothetical protein
MLDRAAMMQLYKENMGKLSSAFEKLTLVPLILSLRRDEFHSRIGNSFPNCQQLYDVERRNL